MSYDFGIPDGTTSAGKACALYSLVLRSVRKCKRAPANITLVPYKTSPYWEVMGMWRGTERPGVPVALRGLAVCSRMRIMVSQNHRLPWVGRDLKDHTVPTPVMGRVANH